MQAKLIGREPACDLGYSYTQTAPYDAIVIGSLTLGEALCFGNEEVLQALADGKPVICYAPGFPQSPKNRALGAQLASAQREMKSWGVIFTDGGRRRLVTAEEARQMRLTGKTPGPGAVLTPLAKEILEGNG